MSVGSREESNVALSDYFDLFGGVRGLCLYVFSGVVLAFGLLWFDVNSAASLLLLPLALGLAVLAGLLFRVAGAMVVFSIFVLVSGFAFFLGLGVFEPLSRLEGFLFFSGFVLMTSGFTLGGGLLVGYSRRSAEVAEQRQNLLYKVFDALPIGIWVRARDGRSLFVNDRWARFSKFSVDEIYTLGGTEPPVDLGVQWTEQIEEVLSQGDGAVRYQSIDLTDNEGHEASMTLLSLRMLIDQENDYGTLSLLIDETAVRLYEEKLRESEQNLHLALNNARMGFWDEAIKGQQIRCDENWYALIGAERDPEVSPLQERENRLHPNDSARVRKEYQDYYRNGHGSLKIDYQIRKGDQDYIWVQDNVRIMAYDADGFPERVVGTMQDMTDQKVAELELKRAMEQAKMGNDMKSQFIATVSHEIRTPLNAIIGLSNLLSENGLEGENLDLAETIHSSGKSLMLLLNDILDFSKIEAGHLRLEVQEFSLIHCFQESVKLFRARAIEKELSMMLHVDPAMAEFAFGDMKRLRQVLQNLLSNAVKFTRAGEVSVSVRPVALSEIDAAYRPSVTFDLGYLDGSDHDYIEVSVQDSGIGIAEDRLHVLFEAFSQVDASTTREYGGTGLGLVICKRLIEAMGGSIWVNSEEGVGTTFTFVVRMKLISDEREFEGVTPVPFGALTRMATEHPCDILVIGAEANTQALLDCCRQLGYFPHSTEDYSLSADGFNRRHYTLCLIWVETEALVMKLILQLARSKELIRPDTIVGFATADSDIGVERCLLGGLDDFVLDEVTPDRMGTIILTALNELD